MEEHIWYSLGESDEGEVMYCTVFVSNSIAILNNEILVCLTN